MTTPLCPISPAAKPHQGHLRDGFRRDADGDHVTSVVLAEDRPVARRFFVDQIDDTARYQVIGQVRDGEALVDAVQRLKPDLVITDLLMPRLDGLRAIRSIRRFSQVPILLFTGARAGLDEVRMAALRAGANAFMVKPSTDVDLALLQASSRDLVAALDKLRDRFRSDTVRGRVGAT